MTHLRSLSALAACALLGACSDYATFVTATNIGISADTTTQEVNIGYTRAELFTGPAYPAQGEAPRVFGYINSDLRVFDPHIQQLYATGDAAALISAPQPPPLPPTVEKVPPPYFGERRPMVFGTGSTVGLNLKFASGSPAPSAIKFGYNRQEVSMIPMQSQTPADEKHADRYAPVLASMDLNLGGTVAKGDTTRTDASAMARTELGITQFFATGTAARNLAAYDKRIRGYFQEQAQVAVQTAANQEVVEAMRKKSETNSDAIGKFFAAIPDDRFEGEREALFRRTGMPANDREFARLRKLSKARFLAYMKENSGTAALLARHLSDAIR